MYFFYILCFVFNFFYFLDAASIVLFIPFYLLILFFSTKYTLYKKKKKLNNLAYEQLIMLVSKMKIWHAYRRLYFYSIFLHLYKFLLVLFEHCLSLFNRYKLHLMRQHLITVEDFVYARYELLLYVSKNQ